MNRFRSNCTSRQPGRLLRSSVIRKLACTLGLTLALGMGTAHAVTIVVNSSADGELGDLPDQCTLRAAVASANDGPGVDGCSSGSFGADEIVFDPALAGATITLNVGQIEITNALTITGPVANDPSGIVLDADGQSRVFLIQGSGFGEFEVNLTGLTLTNGSAMIWGDYGRGGAVLVDSADLDLDHVIVSYSNAVEVGGGLAIQEGNLTLTDSQVIFNQSGNISRGSFGNAGGIRAIAPLGTVTLVRSIVANNESASSGGGLRVNAAALSISDSVISDNKAVTYSGGLASWGADVEMNNVAFTGNFSKTRDGGGFLLGGGTSVMENLTVSGNSIGGAGGGISLHGGEHLLTDSRIFGNTVIEDYGPSAVYGGGGVTIKNAEVTIHSTSIFDNALESPAPVLGGGAGLRIEDSVVLMTDSTIHGNTDLYNPGGGIHVFREKSETSLTLINSTISGNTTTKSGGGLQIDGGHALLLHTTVFGNSADDGADGIQTGISFHAGPGSLQLDNSLVIQAATNEAACDLTEAESVEHANSLATDASCTGIGTNLPDFDIGPLADNGGPTLTHALGPDSVAIDAIPECATNTDQRGIRRPGPGSIACDVGAYEFFTDRIFSSRFESQ